MLRHRSVVASRIGRASRPVAETITVHAPSGGEDGLALCECGGVWTLTAFERGHGFERTRHPHGEASAAAGLVPPQRERPRVAFVGVRHALALAVPPEPGMTGTSDGIPAPIALELRVGVLRGIAREWPFARLSLTGPAPAAARLALALGARVPLRPAGRGLAAEALARVAEPAPVPDPPAGPALRPAMSVDEAIACVTGALARAILHHAPGAAAGEPEAIHQMRVATRRLRSAILVFRAPLNGSLDRIGADIAALAARLGRARDWDVFVAETGGEIAGEMAGDRRIAALLARADIRRAAAHAALARHLGAPQVRRLLLEVALLATRRPWRDATGDDAARREALDAPLATFAAAAVDRRYRRLVRAVPDLAALEPESLHDRRKAAKKLRYAVEFLAPAWPAGKSRKLLRRLARVQDRLGAINDAATGAALVGQLAPGPSGAASREAEGHAFAAGAVCGFLAARAADARTELARDWSSLRRQDRFWGRRRARPSP